MHVIAFEGIVFYHKYLTQAQFDEWRKRNPEQFEALLVEVKKFVQRTGCTTFYSRTIPIEEVMSRQVTILDETSTFNEEDYAFLQERMKRD